MSVARLAENMTWIYMNSTDGQENQTTSTITRRKPSAVVPALMFASGTIGNILALYVLIRSARTHKWKIFYRLVGALALTDLFGIVTTSPVTLITYANDFKWLGGQPLCNYFSFMLIFAGLATVFIVGAMALDRYVAVCFPYYYNNYSKKRRINVMIFGVWVISIFIACLPLMGLGSNVLQYPGTWCFFNFVGTRIPDLIFAYFYSSVGIFIITMTAFLNVFVILSLCRHHGPVPAQKSSKRKQSVVSSISRSKRHNIYIMVFLVAIVIVFGTCWTPLMVRVLINQSKLHGEDKRADLLAVRLASFNQILDPWVYILLRKEFIVKVIICLRRCTRRKNLLYRLTSYSIDQTTVEQNDKGTSISSGRNTDQRKQRQRNKINDAERKILLLKIRISNTETSASENEIRSSNNEIRSSNNEIRGSNNEIRSSNNEIRGSNNEIRGSNNDIRGSNTDISGSNTDISGSRNEISGSKNETKISNTDISGSRNEISGSNGENKTINSEISGSNNDIRDTGDIVERNVQSTKPVSRNDKISVSFV